VFRPREESGAEDEVGSVVEEDERSLGETVERSFVAAVLEGWRCPVLRG
jgi:hypothetical protein